MAGSFVWTVGLVSVFVVGSVQQAAGTACEITSGLSGGQTMNNTITALDNCTSGVISWHYPHGMLNVNFPRALLPDLTHARRRMRVCFRGGIGEGVSLITQKLARRNRIAVHKIQLVDSQANLVCSRPSRDPAGITVTLHSNTRMQYYLKAIHYQAEVLKKGSGRRNGGGRTGGHRKGQGSHRDQGRGHRQGGAHRKGEAHGQGQRTRHGVAEEAKGQ